MFLLMLLLQILLAILSSTAILSLLLLPGSSVWRFGRAGRTVATLAPIAGRSYQALVLSNNITVKKVLLPEGVGKDASSVYHCKRKGTQCRWIRYVKGKGTNKETIELAMICGAMFI